MPTNQLKTTSCEDTQLISLGTNQFAIDLMLEVYKSIANGANIIYCSTPITSGKRYIEWLKKIDERFADLDNIDNGYRQAHYNEVIEPNCSHAQQFVQTLRTKSNCIVIDPTGLPSLSGWTQEDWRSFWGKVIERYATEAFFLNDWQYSNGCVYEFWEASRKGIPIFNEEKQVITLDAGLRLITEAVIAMQQYNQSTVFIEKISEDIKQLVV